MARLAHVVLIGHAGSYGLEDAQAKLAATVGREAFEWLDAPVARLGALDTPVPFAKALEALYLLAY